MASHSVMLRASHSSIGQRIAVYRLRFPRSEPPAVFRETLHASDIQRLRRLRDDDTAWRFFFGRALLRTVLARRLKVAPAALEFVADHHGKPTLLDWPNLHFNLSHSGDLALCAVAWNCPLGVDIERTDSRGFPERVIARRFFEEEQAWVAAQPAAARSIAAFRIWTLKEAVAKADGRGLWHGLDKFAFEPGPDGQELRLAGAPFAPDGCDVFGGAAADHAWALAMRRPAAAPPPRVHVQDVSVVALEKTLACLASL